MSKQLDRLRQNYPAIIRNIFAARGNVLIEFYPGWRDSMSGEHFIREATVREALAQWRSSQPCTCDACRKAIRKENRAGLRVVDRSGGMSKFTVTYEVALAIGRDAGNRSAKAGGRETWNEDDWNAASEAFLRAQGMIATPRSCLLMQSDDSA